MKVTFFLKESTKNFSYDRMWWLPNKIILKLKGSKMIYNSKKMRKTINRSFLFPLDFMPIKRRTIWSKLKNRKVNFITPNKRNKLPDWLRKKIWLNQNYLYSSKRSKRRIYLWKKGKNHQKKLLVKQSLKFLIKLFNLWLAKDIQEKS